MRVLPSLLSALLLAWSVRGFVLPGEQRVSPEPDEVLSRVQKDVLLKVLTGLLDGRENNLIGGDSSLSADSEEPKEDQTRLEYRKSLHLPPRDRKVPCRHFYWKTYTPC
ncbi:somatostatin-2-like [Lissotriton helveticus]